MSILSQIGILILIGCIIFILIRSNKSLEKASEEGEHFVDEWALRQQKKEERKLEKEERRLEKTRRKQQKTDSRNRQSEELYEEEDDTWDDVSDDREIWNREEEDDARGDASDAGIPGSGMPASDDRGTGTPGGRKLFPCMIMLIRGSRLYSSMRRTGRPPASA